jgi:hypothetical protein
MTMRERAETKLLILEVARDVMREVYRTAPKGTIPALFMRVKDGVEREHERARIDAARLCSE